MTSDIVPPDGELAGPGVDVIDTTTGEHLRLPAVAAVASKALAAEPSGWLGADTVSVQWISDRDGSEQLLTCDVREVTCEVVLDDVTGVVDDVNLLTGFPGMPSYARPTVDELSDVTQLPDLDGPS